MYTFKRKLFFLLFLAPCFLLLNTYGQESTEQKVSGSVRDASTGLPLSGASVSIPGYSSTATNDSGLFTIKVPDYKATLEIFIKDYQLKVVALKGKSSVDVKLYESSFNSQYDEVNLPYSIVTRNMSVNSATEINNDPANSSTSPESMMQGKIAGLNVTTRSGVPGIGANMFLHGYSSLFATNKPLIVIDGMIYDYDSYSQSAILGYVSDPLADINMRDIDNVTVLKDAVSLYGAKAANGVIIINTVHAKDEATKVDFYGQGGINFSPENLPVMNGSDYRSYVAEQLQNKGFSSDQIQAQPYMATDPSSPYFLKYNNNVNWQDQVFNNTSSSQDYCLRVTGGDEIAKYGLSVGYIKNQGIIKQTDYSRYNVRFNSAVTLSPKFTVDINLGFAYGDHHLVNDGLDASKINPIYLALTKGPIFTPKVLDNYGKVTQVDENVDSLGIGNPIAIMNRMLAENVAHRFTGSFNLKYKVTNHLNISTLFGLNFDKNEETGYIPDLGAVVNDTLYTDLAYSTAVSNIQRFNSIYSDTRLSYNRNFNQKHDFSFVAGARYNVNTFRYDLANAFNTPIDALKYLNSGNSLLDQVSGDNENWKWMSFYAGADYAFRKKYIVSLNISTDGSSRFGTDADGYTMFSHKFATFPSVGAAWLISSEGFMSSLSFVDLLKARVSYGLTGNDDIGNYAGVKYYSSQENMGYSGLIRGNIPNTGIQWETNKKFNVGLDIALFDERVQVTADYYQNVTDNMLTLNPLDIVSGNTEATLNNGSMKNDGMEVTLNTRLINSRVKWDVGAGISMYRNKITKMPGGSMLSALGGTTTITEKGQPLGMFYGYTALGVFASDAEAAASGQKNKMANGDLVDARGGDVHFADLDGNSVIDENDRQIIGNPNPDFTGMFSTHVSWKRLSLDALFTFSYGNDVYNTLRSRLESVSGFENQTTAVLNRWKSDGQVTNVPKATWGDPMGNARVSNRWVEDGSYLKLKSVSISYDLPWKVGFMKNAMIYLSANNLLTFTKYLGYDPEFSMSTRSYAQGIDYGLTPMYRSMFIGVKIGL